MLHRVTEESLASVNADLANASRVTLATDVLSGRLSALLASHAGSRLEQALLHKLIAAAGLVERNTRSVITAEEDGVDNQSVANARAAALTAYAFDLMMREIIGGDPVEHANALAGSDLQVLPYTAATPAVFPVLVNKKWTQQHGIDPAKGRLYTNDAGLYITATSPPELPDTTVRALGAERAEDIATHTDHVLLIAAVGASALTGQPQSAS